MPDDIRMIPPLVGSRSCVAVYGDFPHGHGNYFDFHCGLRCVNMWSENLDEIVKRMSIAEIKVKVYDDHFAFVIDERIPPEWINEEMCLTGAFRGTTSKLLKEMLDFCGESHYSWICGCEDDDMHPYISEIGEDINGKWVMSFKCHHCKRKWSELPEGSLAVYGSENIS